mmetsp:Transcript_28742/g.33391  ORF Transcript_28742/g.33391 Transcript_28742/m.33391 type:complete len:82 (-) Transcript_28742:353-598(-)
MTSFKKTNFYVLNDVMMYIILSKQRFKIQFTSLAHISRKKLWVILSQNLIHYNNSRCSFTCCVLRINEIMNICDPPKSIVI